MNLNYTKRTKITRNTKVIHSIASHDVLSPYQKHGIQRMAVWSSSASYTQQHLLNKLLSTENIISHNLPFSFSFLL